ncbi:MAG: hypothetical protein PHR51_00115 [Patescibacteria group bacterium]|nr:hypothetical protein [Patescibacteria group bacterium]
MEKPAVLDDSFAVPITDRSQALRLIHNAIARRWLTSHDGLMVVVGTYQVLTDSSCREERRLEVVFDGSAVRIWFGSRSAFCAIAGLSYIESNLANCETLRTLLQEELPSPVAAATLARVRQTINTQQLQPAG